MIEVNTQHNTKGAMDNIVDKKQIFMQLVNDIILGNFITSDYMKDSYININTKYFQFKLYYTYEQNINNMCGFHSLFNIYYFLKYLTSNESNDEKNKYLFQIKNAWSFWSFYKESINYLLSNLPLEDKAKKSLMTGGPLERYQFVYLLPLAPQQAIDFLCVADPRIFRKQPVKFADVLPGLVGGQIIGVPRYNLIVQDHCVLSFFTKA
jgi:hypothetical protein